MDAQACLNNGSFPMTRLISQDKELPIQPGTFDMSSVKVLIQNLFRSWKNTKAGCTWIPAMMHPTAIDRY